MSPGVAVEEKFQQQLNAGLGGYEGVYHNVRQSAKRKGLRMKIDNSTLSGIGRFLEFE